MLQKFSVLFVLLLLFSSLGAVTGTTETLDNKKIGAKKEKTQEKDVEWKTFTQAEKGYQISYPSNWEVMEKAFGAEVVLREKAGMGPDPNLTNNVNVITSTIDSPISLDEFNNASLEELKKSLDKFNLISSNTVDINGINGVENIYTFSVGAQSFKMVQYLLLDRQNVYIITSITTPKDFKRVQDTFSRIAHSFKVSN